jgi:hypothetical protein
MNQDHRRSRRQEIPPDYDCPSATPGSVILHVVRNNSGSFVHQKQIHSHSAPYLNVKESQVSKSWQEFDHRIVPVRNSHKIPTQQPETGVFFGNQLVSESIGFWVASDKNLSWMARALEMGTASSRPAWRSTLLAASLLFHGQRLGHVVTKVEYRQYYGKGLSYQRCLLQRLCNTSITPTIEDIVNTMILGWIEAMHSTSVSGAKQHLYAAASLLDRIGPRNCQTGGLWVLFRHARLVNVSITEA